MVGRNESDENVDDDDDDDDNNYDDNAREEDENEEGKNKNVDPVPAPEPADDGGANADDEMLKINYWDDNPWCRGQVHGASKKVEGGSRRLCLPIPCWNKSNFSYHKLAVVIIRSPNNSIWFSVYIWQPYNILVTD